MPSRRDSFAIAAAYSTMPEGQRHHLIAELEDAGVRLDRFLAGRLPGESRSRLQSLIREGHVGSAGRTIEEPGYRVKSGQSFDVVVPVLEPAAPKGEAIALVIVHEDADLIVIDKPAGLVVHPGAGHGAGTLVNALIAHCGESLSGIGGVRRPGIVHRLDKDTSGLLVVAKTDRAHRGLAEQFAAHGRDGRLLRSYLALIWGVPRRRAGTIATELARKPSNRTKMAVAPAGRGRSAVTHYEVLRSFAGQGGAPAVSLVRCALETGRTHQIRVHMAHLGHPLLGDATYGAGFAASRSRLGARAQAALERLGRQALHAAVLGFVHPVTGKKLQFQSELPEDMARIIAAM